MDSRHAEEMEKQACSIEDCDQRHCTRCSAHMPWYNGPPTPCSSCESDLDVEETPKQAPVFRRDDGKFDYSDMDKMCRCGHRLGVHGAAGPRGCMNNDCGDGEDCDCEKFRPQRAKKVRA
jgi:hypothetical protein